MSRISVFFLAVIAPLMAGVLALLGISTLPDNPLGWLLLLIGAGYIVGLMAAYVVRGRRIWESPLASAAGGEERGDRSFWPVVLGMSAAFYLSPWEYLALPARLPRMPWMALAGFGLVVLGIALFVSARRALGSRFSGHLAVQGGQALVQSGPYRFIRHPAYAGYLLMALGVALGYASLAGLVSILLVLLPGLYYRMKVEDDLLAQHLGAGCREYQRKTKRLIPWLW